MRKPVILTLLVLLSCIQIYGQTGFDPGVYSTYLKTNQDLTYDQLLSRYPAGTYYQDRLFPAEPYKYAYIDSLVHAFVITEDELVLLAKNKFVVTERLSYENMVVALDDIFHKDLPVFITTDFILHALHLSYDKILMDLEIRVLEPNLHQILLLMRESYPALAEKYEQAEGLRAALKDVDLYLTIALSLADSTRHSPLAADKQQADAILDAIYAEYLFEYPLFSDRNRYLDFSQFRPRGHYTDPSEPWDDWKTRASYFQAMMWLGRMDFYLTPPPAPPPMIPWSKEEIRRMHLSAFMLQELLETSGAIDVLLENEGIIGFMVGESNNLLYAKQSYTWAVICSFPHSYVEPYPEFYRRIEDFCDVAHTYFSGNARVGYSITSYFNNVRIIMQQLAVIAEKELRLEPLAGEEITFLEEMIREQVHECDPLYLGWFVDLFYDIYRFLWEDNYVIADVHTQATDRGGNLIGKILHAATGKINLGIFLAGSPSDSYKPVPFVGPCMSFYEHTTLGWDRKTDEWWAGTIKNGFPQRPDWTNVYLVNSAGSGNMGGLRLQDSVYEGKHDT